MAKKQIKWPDLSVYGVVLKRWMGPEKGVDAEQGDRYAVIYPLAESMDVDLKEALATSGFEEAWIDGQSIMRRQGSFGSSDLKSTFPDVISETGFAHQVLEGDAQIEKICNLRGEFGPAPVLEEAPVEEVAEVEEIDDDLEGMLGALVEGLEDAPEAEATEAPESEVVAPEVAVEPAVEAEVAPAVVEVKEPAPAKEVAKDKVVKAAPKEEAKAPAPVAIRNDVEMTDSSFDGFEAYLIYQGIPALAREEFMTALPHLVSFLKTQESESDLAKGAWETPQHPGEVRKLFKEKCDPADKQFAKTKIIEPLYPLAFDFVAVQCDPEVRETMNTFAAENGAEMDEFTSWYEGFARDCLNADGKSYTSQLERGMRALGSRIAVQMCKSGENTRSADRHLRENDVRFVFMDMKGAAVMDNTKQGFINPVRKDEVRRNQVIEKFETLMPSLEVEADAPKMTA
ncbi:hypothetical protein [Sulfitobacter sp. R18_1]|uniref:hypothetical protein n=1 Tax=Sulfitobacter sp. R18_1 TaxID=2821104 RepID=UPI001ADD013F|nr:hypothetical protein [Sulfitobacter sp. R18_1]MBO9428657.1 hypothetical protein [Sulfitobacter sp. R18_1]